LPDSWYRIENRTLPSPVAVVYIHDQIGGWGITAQDFARDLRAITADRIKVHINSPGGSVFEGLAIYNALKSTRATIETHADALAASIASVIFQAGDKRVMAPHSRLMIHEAANMADGNAEELTKMVERLNDASNNIASVYAERAGKDPTHWRDLMRAETWFSEAAAVEAGLADAIGLDEEDEDEKALAIGVLLNLPRHEMAACLTGTERTLAPAELSRLHEAFQTLNKLHGTACGMGDSCPLPHESTSNTGGEPTNRHEVRRREVDRILASNRH
jgi:ATP-dependent Clp endopeptidase proteolytic subunit ClpP